jgi:histone-lysine N-methyltransferase SUV39H
MTSITYLKEGKATIPKDISKALKPAITDNIVKEAKERMALQRWQDKLNRRIIILKEQSC